MQSFISLCDFAKNNNEIVNELNEEFNQLLLKGMIVAQLRNYNDYFRKKNVKECDIELYGKKLKEYIRKIKNGYYCLNIINCIHFNYLFIYQFIDYVHDFFDKEKV